MAVRYWNEARRFQPFKRVHTQRGTVVVLLYG